MKDQCKMNDFQQIVSAADVRRDSQISVAVSVILWTASEASTAEISLKLLEIPQKLFNVFFNCNVLPVPCQERFPKSC